MHYHRKYSLNAQYRPDLLETSGTKSSIMVEGKLQGGWQLDGNTTGWWDRWIGSRDGNRTFLISDFLIQNQIRTVSNY